jgi:2-polyprenyl-6-methoxyphenol hydroxylase-like FAD-dependent oxidoreductase
VALGLTDLGVDVEVIDEENMSRGARYAVVLHPASLQMLKHLGLAQDLVSVGQRIEAVDLCDAIGVHASLDMARSGTEFPFALTLMLSDLETALERGLKDRGVAVHWNHRFAGVDASTLPLVAEIEKLNVVSTGYIIPHTATVVQKSYSLESTFVIGADGPHSLVRQRMNLPVSDAGRLERFIMFEGRTRAPLRSAVSVVFHDEGNAVLWPLPGNRWRWLFELGAADPGDPRHRDSVLSALGGWVMEDVDAGTLATLLSQRAPWFDGSNLTVEFGVELWAEPRLVESFGVSHVWLAGDAAHLGGPLVNASLNVGMREANDLAGRLTRILHDGAGDELMAAYGADRAREWRARFRVDSGPTVSGAASSWVAAHAGRLGAFLPATGVELRRLFQQVGLAMA